MMIKLGKRVKQLQTVVILSMGAGAYYSLVPGKIKIEDDGSNSRDENQQGQYHLREMEPPEKVQEIINNLMMHQPKNK